MRLLLILLALATCAGGLMRASAAEPPIEIDAVLSLTGPVAFLGKSEAELLQVAEEVVNRSGGIKGRPIHFAISDDQGSPQVGVQLANALVAKHAPVAIGPSLSAVCNAMMPLVQNGPVIFCLTPSVRPPAGGYAFSTSVTSVYTLGVGLRYFRERGWKRIALAATIDATGQDYEQSTNAVLALPENRSMQLVAVERFGGGDINVAAQISRIRAANAQALVIGASGTPFGTFLHGLNDAGLALPVFTTGGNATPAALAQYAAYLPRDLYFSSLLGQMPGIVGNGPIIDAQTVFFNAMRAHNIRPDVGQIVTWDPAMLVVDAYRRFGATMTAEQFHEYLEHLHGWAGINGLYDYRDGGQRGLFENNVVVFRWDATRNAVLWVTRAGGSLR